MQVQPLSWLIHLDFSNLISVTQSVVDTFALKMLVLLHLERMLAGWLETPKSYISNLSPVKEIHQVTRAFNVNCMFEPYVKL